jgi:hypothetical protein
MQVREDFKLNVDLSSMLSKVNIHVPLTEICKIPAMKKEVKKLLILDDPPINISSQYFNGRINSTPPFYVTLVMNGFRVNNCIIDSGASATVMPINVFKKLGLGISRGYGNICGMDSKRVKVFEVAQDVDMYLYHLPQRSFPIDIVVVDVLDAWGMLLSRD